MRFRCRCVWRDAQCPNLATQEDGLCDWCAPSGARTDEQLASNPKAVFSALTGEFLALGGNDELHDGTSENPGACWYPDSGRTLHPLLQMRGEHIPDESA